MLEIIKTEMKWLHDNENYYGSKQQIETEKMIIKFAFKDLGIEMEYNECIEEFYFRVSEAYKLQA
tara:strand:- start:329 stop:523 length:195 start_codon:yes stop_codon:yes gene_type:complete